MKIKTKKIENAEQYIEIWKFFSQRKEELQVRLYSFITWSVAAFMVFLTFSLKEWECLEYQFPFWNLFFWIITIIWIFMTLLFSVLIYKHKKRNEIRQKQAAQRIKGLDKIIKINCRC